MLFRDGGDIGLFITQVPKVSNIVFLFAQLLWGLLLNLDWLIFKMSVKTFQPLIVRYANFV